MYVHSFYMYNYNYYISIKTKGPVSGQLVSPYLVAMVCLQKLNLESDYLDLLVAHFCLVSHYLPVYHSAFCI